MSEKAACKSNSSLLPWLNFNITVEHNHKLVLLQAQLLRDPERKMPPYFPLIRFSFLVQLTLLKQKPRMREWMCLRHTHRYPVRGSRLRSLIRIRGIL